MGTFFDPTLGYHVLLRDSFHLLVGRISGNCLGKKGWVPKAHTAKLRKMNVMNDFISTTLVTINWVCQRGEDKLAGRFEIAVVLFVILTENKI